MNTLTKDKYLSQEEILELNRVLNLIRQNNQRDVLLIELALNCGARQEELLTITRSDLDRTQRSVFIANPGKGSSKREIPLPDDLFKRLWDYSEMINGPIFPISTSRVRQLWSDIRPFKKKFHSLRHSFGRNMYAKTRDIRLVQYFLGHRSITNTQIYLSIDYDAETTRRAIGL